MQYLTCPRCHSSFRTGVFYQTPEVCPRCGAPFQPPRPSLWEHLREGVGPRVRGDAPDWEAITGSQYTGHVLTRTNPAGGPDGSHSPSAPVASPRDRSANTATRVAEQFHRQDKEYLEWLHAHRHDGYVLNAAGSKSRLHRANCVHLWRVIEEGRRLTDQYPKVCSTSLAELTPMLGSGRPCPVCAP
jgi:hypothetical protein